MRKVQNSLKIIWLFEILIFPISGQVKVIVDIGANLTLPDLGAPAQVPWVGPLPACNLNLNDSALAGCFAGIVNDVKQSWSYNGGGIPGLGIPNMDPYYFQEIYVDASSPTLEFYATCTDISMTGFNGLSNMQFSLDTAGKSISFSLMYPSLRLVGNYVAFGTYFSILPIPYSQGGFWLLFDTLTFFGTANLTTKTVNGTTVLQAYNINTDFTIIDYAFEFEGIGGLLLAPIVNTVAYLCRGTILSSMKPEMDSKNNEILTNIVNAFLPTQPYLAARFGGT